MKRKSKKKQSEPMHPDHSSEIIRVRRIIGQLEGVEKMIVARRYCPQILQQVKAATSAMNALKMEILKKHLNECLNDSASSGNYSKLLEQVLEIVQTQIRDK
ncbi:MAG: metal-sensitive transcriptional regulator [Bdellovibrionales bacterium]|nr:metal-sensitive transcriptional regulator [Bdellovibrionales bacterium]